MNKPCSNMQDQIADYVLGALDAPQAETLREHLGQCAGCRRYLQSLKEQGDALVELGKQVGVGMSARQDKVIEALQRVAPAEPTGGRVVPFIGGFMRIAVAAVLVLGAGIVIGRRTATRPVDVEQLRTEMEASVAGSLHAALREDVLAEVDQRVQAGLAAGDERLRIEVVEQIRRDLRLLTAQLAANSQRLVDQRFADMVQLIEASRRADRDRVAKALEQITTRTGLGFQTLAARASDSSDTLQN
jgi:anti-sigma factor RsiW